MSKFGFNFKGSSKRQKLVDVEQPEQHKIEISSIEASCIQSKEPIEKGIELIIPVPSSFPSSKRPSIENLAEQEILDELNAPITNDDKDALVIGDGGNNSSSIGKKKPILMANIPKELLVLDNDDDRYKADILLRAEDVNFRSAIYDDVPVEQFGAAVLRGMGWNPSEPNQKTGKNDEPIVPRVSRLGLGAAPKPGEKKHGSKTAKPGEKKDKQELDNAAWVKKAVSKLDKQHLYENDLIWIRDPSYVGVRAKVVQVNGVPGLDRIR